MNIKFEINFSASVAILTVVRLDGHPRVRRVLPDPLEGPVGLLPLVIAHAAPVADASVHCDHLAPLPQLPVQDALPGVQQAVVDVGWHHLCQNMQVFAHFWSVLHLINL